MAKNRVRLDISGVSCTLLTEEDEAYVKDMAKEVEELLNSMTNAGSSFAVAAVITALSFLDEKKKNEKTCRETEERLQVREKDVLLAVAEYKKLKTENDILTAKLKNLKKELESRPAADEEPKPKAMTAVGELRNPFRPQIDETGLVSYYEKK